MWGEIMAEVKWVKLTTDMFDNRKVKHLRKLPDGNNIVLIWVMLLTMAGRCNSGGMIFLTENIPYTPKMLADELDFEENTVIILGSHCFIPIILILPMSPMGPMTPMSPINPMSPMTPIIYIARCLRAI